MSSFCQRLKKFFSRRSLSKLSPKVSSSTEKDKEDTDSEYECKHCGKLFHRKEAIVMSKTRKFLAYDSETPLTKLRFQQRLRP